MVQQLRLEDWAWQIAADVYRLNLYSRLTGRAAPGDAVSDEQLARQSAKASLKRTTLLIAKWLSWRPMPLYRLTIASSHAMSNRRALKSSELTARRRAWLLVAWETRFSCVNPAPDRAAAGYFALGWTSWLAQLTRWATGGTDVADFELHHGTRNEAANIGHACWHAIDIFIHGPRNGPSGEVGSDNHRFRWHIPPLSVQTDAVSLPLLSQSGPATAIPSVFEQHGPLPLLRLSNQ